MKNNLLSILINRFSFAANATPEMTKSVSVNSVHTLPVNFFLGFHYHGGTIKMLKVRRAISDSRLSAGKIIL